MVYTMRKIILPILLFAFLLSCNKNGDIVNPDLSTNIFSNSGKWVEVLRVDSLGRENLNGNYTVKNLLEFFDTTYEFTSKTIELEDSTNILEDQFFIYHEGKFSSRNDTLSLFTSDKDYLSSLKTNLVNDTLWVGGIKQCTKDGAGHSYSCIGVRPNLVLPLYMSSFIWNKFQSKKTATFIKN
jgi:hypothetical protein